MQHQETAVAKAYVHMMFLKEATAKELEVGRVNSAGASGSLLVQWGIDVVQFSQALAQGREQAKGQVVSCLQQQPGTTLQGTIKVVAQALGLYLRRAGHHHQLAPQGLCQVLYHGYLAYAMRAQ